MIPCCCWPETDPIYGRRNSELRSREMCAQGMNHRSSRRMVIFTMANRTIDRTCVAVCLSKLRLNHVVTDEQHTLVERFRLEKICRCKGLSRCHLVRLNAASRKISLETSGGILSKIYRLPASGRSVMEKMKELTVWMENKPEYWRPWERLLAKPRSISWPS